MLELKTKGVDELARVKNRVARLYGLGRLSYASFTELHTSIVALEELLKGAEERDDSDQQSEAGESKN